VRGSGVFFFSEKPVDINEIRRWQAADSALAGDGLNVPAFAAGYNLSTKTIVRLLSSLTALGHTHSTTITADGRYVHRYDRGVSPLFAGTKGKAGRKRKSADKTAEILAAINRHTDGTRSLTAIYREVAKELGIGYGTVFREAKADAESAPG